MRRSKAESCSPQSTDGGAVNATDEPLMGTEEEPKTEEVKALQRKVQRLRARAAQQHKSSQESKQRMAELQEQVKTPTLTVFSVA